MTCLRKNVFVIIRLLKQWYFFSKNKCKRSIINILIPINQSMYMNSNNNNYIQHCTPMAMSSGIFYKYVIKLIFEILLASMGHMFIPPTLFGESVTWSNVCPNLLHAQSKHIKGCWFRFNFEPTCIIQTTAKQPRRYWHPHYASTNKIIFS